MKDVLGLWGSVLAAVIAAEPTASTIAIVAIIGTLITVVSVMRHRSTTVLPPSDDTHVPEEFLSALTDHTVNFASFIYDMQTILEALSLGPRSYSGIRRYLEIAGSGMRAKATSEVIQALVKGELVRSKDGRFELTRKGRAFLSCLDTA